MAIHLVSGWQPATGRVVGSGTENSASTGQGVDFASLLCGLSASVPPLIPRTGSEADLHSADNVPDASASLRPDPGPEVNPPAPLLTATPIAFAQATLPAMATKNAGSAASSRIDVASAAITGTVQASPSQVDLVVPNSRTSDADIDLLLTGRLPSPVVGATASVAKISRLDTGNTRIHAGDGSVSPILAIAEQSVAPIAVPGNDELHQQPLADEPEPAINASPEWFSSSAWLPGAPPVLAAAQPAVIPLTVNTEPLSARLQPTVVEVENRLQRSFGEADEHSSQRSSGGQAEYRPPLSALVDGMEAPLAAAGHLLPRQEAAAQTISAAAQPLPASFAEIVQATASRERLAPHPTEVAVADTAAMPTLSENPLAFISPTTQNAFAHANPPVAPQTLQTPLHDPSWNVEFGQKVLWIAHHDQQQAHLTINPPHLGAIEISVNLNPDNSASAAFVAADAEVRSALESSLPRLREMFATAGIDLGQVSVGSESFRQSSERQQHAPRTPRGMADKAILGNDLTGVSSASGLAGRIGDGLVDTFA